MFLKDILKYFVQKLTLYFEGIVLILRTMEYSLDIMFCVKTFRKSFWWMLPLVLLNFYQYHFCSLVFILYTFCNSIRNHLSAVFLKQRKLGEMLDLSSFNDLCVI